MKSILELRQMMADQKFFEVQLLIEVQISLDSSSRHELLLLYFEALEAQGKKLSEHLTLELAELETNAKNYSFVEKLINSLGREKYFLRLSRLKVKVAEDQGRIDKLHQIISELYIHQYEEQVPFIPEWVNEISNKYFKNDFGLKLRAFGVSLLRKDIKSLENNVKELLISCVEKSSSRGVKDKLISIAELLQTTDNKGVLEIYQNFCLISTRGIKEKSDYKKIIEVLIYFQDFKLQIIALNLLHQLTLSEEAQAYASSVRSAEDYSFVYIDKYFPDLKPYFIEADEAQPEGADFRNEISKPDLSLTENTHEETVKDEEKFEEASEENTLVQLLKYQSYTSDQLCDLAVNFLQLEMPKAALKASEMAIASSANDKEYLKASYLKLTCLLKLGDNRGALDTSLMALERASSRDDVLSFLYGQAEEHIRLNQKKEAKKILSKVLSIDSEYRMAKERINKL